MALHVIFDDGKSTVIEPVDQAKVSFEGKDASLTVVTIMGSKPTRENIIRFVDDKGVADFLSMLVDPEAAVKLATRMAKQSGDPALMALNDAFVSLARADTENMTPEQIEALLNDVLKAIGDEE